MTTTKSYKLRITQSTEQLETIRQRLADYFNDNQITYLIGPIEQGHQTQKFHFHGYLETNNKRNIIDQLKRRNIIETGNQTYQMPQIKYEQFEDVKKYQSYCLKTNREDYKTSYTQEYIQSIIPIWKPESEYKKIKQKSRESFKQYLKNNYKKITNNNHSENQKHILDYVITQFKEQEKLFSMSQLRMYCNYLELQFYSDYISIDILHYELTKYTSSFM